MFAGIFAQNLAENVSLAEFAYCFSPFVEETSPNLVVIDVEGCALRFGSAYELATVIARQAQLPPNLNGLGCSVNVALAANPDVAIHAAKSCKGITYTAPGEELICTGKLPIDALEYALVNLEPESAAEIFATLKLWGVHTFEQFAALPVAGVSERLGQAGVKLQQLAAGKTDRHLKIKTAAPVFENAIELEFPVAELEPLSFILARLLNQICASLQAYALATNTLQVQLKLENKKLHELIINLPYPMRDHKVFLKLLLLEAERNAPSCAVIAVIVHCEPVKPRVLQTGLFIPLAPEPAKLELTLARLVKLVGLENVGSPKLLDTYRPDAFRINKFVLKENGKRKGRRAIKRRFLADGLVQQNGGSESQPADSRFQIPDSRFNPTRNPKLETQNSKLETRNPKPETGNPKPARRNSKLKLRNPKPETRNSIFETRNPKPETRNSKLTTAFRRFRPPLRAIVDAAQGYPREVNAWGKERSVYGKVIGLAGPWRSSGEWWRPDVWAYDEWDVAIEERGQHSRNGSQGSDGFAQGAVLYRIYRELKNGSWFIEGVYD